MRGIYLFSVLVLGLAACDRSFVKMNLVTRNGPSPAFDVLQVIMTDKDGNTDTQEFSLAPPQEIPSVGGLSFGLNFPGSFRGQEVTIEVRGFRNDVDVLSGVTTAIVGDDEIGVQITAEFCGDQIEDPLRNEECDDANNIEGDGCDSNCTISACGNGIRAPGELCFLPPVSIPTGNGPVFIAAADFNGDEFLDLANTNETSNNVSVLLGNGDGTFQPPQVFLVGSAPTIMVIEDLNNDRFPDMVTANIGSDDISILLGNGDGSFQSKEDLALGEGLRFIVAGDFDLDSSVDLVSTHNISDGFDSVKFLSGDGAGSFLEPQESITTNPGSLVVRDFDADDILDLAIGEDDSDQIRILKGEGNGTFSGSAFQVFDIGGGPPFIISEDFNEDGFDDLVSANLFTDNVSVLLGSGGGFFEEPVLFDVSGASPASVISEDLNNDGVLDLVVTNNLSNNINIFLGDGTGSFSLNNNLVVGDSPGLTTAGDFNQDGFLDLAVANGGSDDISLFLSAEP